MIKEEVIKNMEKIVENCMGDETPACVQCIQMSKNM